MSAQATRAWSSIHSYVKTKLKIPHLTEVSLFDSTWQGLESRNITFADELDFNVAEFDGIYKNNSMKSDT